MATHALPSSHILGDDEASVLAQPGTPSLMRRVYDALLESQRRRANREIDRVLGHGAFSRAFHAELPPER